MKWANALQRNQLSARATTHQLLVFQPRLPTRPPVPALKDRTLNLSGFLFSVCLPTVHFPPTFYMVTTAIISPSSQGTHQPPQLENSGGRLVSRSRGTSILQSDSCDGYLLLYLGPPSKDSGGSDGGSNMVKSAELNG